MATDNSGNSIKFKLAKPNAPKIRRAAHKLNSTQPISNLTPEGDLTDATSTPLVQSFSGKTGTPERDQNRSTTTGMQQGDAVSPAKPNKAMQAPSSHIKTTQQTPPPKAKPTSTRTPDILPDDDPKDYPVTIKASSPVDERYQKLIQWKDTHKLTWRVANVLWVKSGYAANNKIKPNTITNQGLQKYYTTWSKRYYQASGEEPLPTVKSKKRTFGEAEDDGEVAGGVSALENGDMDKEKKRKVSRVVKRAKKDRPSAGGASQPDDFYNAAHCYGISQEVYDAYVAAMQRADSRHMHALEDLLHT